PPCPSTDPIFSLVPIPHARYRIREPSQVFRPSEKPLLTVPSRYLADGVAVTVRSIVRRREPHLPYGDELRELMIVPAIAVNVTPRIAIVPLAAAGKTVELRVELLNNVQNGGAGQLALQLPSGWTSKPEAARFSFSRSGERSAYRFIVSVPSLENRDY